MTQPAAEEHTTITLSDFAARALEGEAMTVALRDDSKVELRVFSPAETDLIAVQRLMMRIVKAADAMTSEADISDDDATLAYELGLAALHACVRDENGEPIADAAIVDLFSRLPYKSPLMLRCQELCGVSLMTVPPLDGKVAIEAMKTEVKAMAAEAKPNRKARRAAKKV